MSGVPAGAADLRPPGGPVVRVDRVGLDVPGRPGVLDEVSLHVAPGELVVLSGRSGSGKSSLCHLIAGVGRPTRGTVDVLGRPAHDWADWTRVTLLPQRLALAAELSVAENVAWPCWLAGATPRPGLLEALALDHIADRLTGESSLGEQQRTALARALATSPGCAVLDEPTGHQDDGNAERVVDAIVARTPGTAVVVATHDERLLAVADRVVRLEAGRLVTAAG